MTTWLDGVPRPDHGPGMVQRSCRCGASWVGGPTDGCWWCERATAARLERIRRDLLDPPHLRTDEGTVRYDDLDELDRAVWDRTRGQMRGAGSEGAWAHQLAVAVRRGVVTEADARQALARVKRRRGAA